MAFAYAFLLAVTIKGSTASDVSSIYCGDICSATDGSSYTLTCTLSGAITSGITWEKNNALELACNTVGKCVSSTPGYANGTYPTPSTATLTITSFNIANDGGNWDCVDGSGQPKSCNLSAIASRTVKLDITCVMSGLDHLVTCSLDDHGTPPITLELRDGSTVIAFTTTAGSLQRTISDAVEKTYTCAVSGPQSLCTTPKSVDIKCQADLLGLDVCAYVLVIILIIIVAVLLFKERSNTKCKVPACVMAAILTFISLLFIILLFVLHEACSDAKCIVAVIICILGLIVGIVAMGRLFREKIRQCCCSTPCVCNSAE